jgi:hypothetical protein
MKEIQQAIEFYEKITLSKKKKKKKRIALGCINLAK